MQDYTTPIYMHDSIKPQKYSSSESNVIYIAWWRRCLVRLVVNNSLMFLCIVFTFVSLWIIHAIEYGDALTLISRHVSRALHPKTQPSPILLCVLCRKMYHYLIKSPKALKKPNSCTVCIKEHTWLKAHLKCAKRWSLWICSMCFFSSPKRKTL